MAPISPYRDLYSLPASVHRFMEITSIGTNTPDKEPDMVKTLPKSMVNKRKFTHRYKMLKGCAHCGFKEHPAALQFDHLNPITKHRSLRTALTPYATKRSMIHLAWDAMKNEIRQCQILCANCHAVKSYKENYNG